MFDLLSILALSTAASLIDAVPTVESQNDNSTEFSKRDSNPVAIYYYNDYDSCYNSYYNKQGSAVQTYQYNINDNGGCFRRLSFPYYTMTWDDTVELTQVCNAASDTLCGSECSGKADRNSALVCDNNAVTFGFTP